MEDSGGGALHDIVGYWAEYFETPLRLPAVGRPAGGSGYAIFLQNVETF
jgi:hypothetical protein